MTKTHISMDQASEHKGGELQNTPSVDIEKDLPSRRFNPLKFMVKTLLIILFLGVVCIGVLLFALSRGAISNEHITAQIEDEVTQALGPGFSVEFENAKLAIGHGGLIAVDLVNAKLLRDQSTNLGAVESVAVTLEAFPLMRGDVKAKSLFMDGATIALSPYLPVLVEDTEKLLPWPKHLDVALVMKGLGGTLIEFGRTLEESGLTSIVLTDAKLTDFDRLGMKAKAGRIVELRLQALDAGAGQFSYKLNVELDEKDWEIKGEWRLDQSGAPILTVSADGVSLSDFPDIHIKQNDYLTLAGQMSLSMSVPFSANGDPKQSVYKIEIGESSAHFKGDVVSKIVGAELNFRYFPEENQLEMERSPIRLQTTEFSLVGGIKYPAKLGLETDNRPVFQLLTENFSAFSDKGSASDTTAVGEILGWVDTENRILVGSTLTLKTQTGELNGSGSISFAEKRPAFKAEFSTKTISLSSLKNFWPELIAKDLRKWTMDNVSGGLISHANLSIDFPPGMLGNAPSYAPENISGTIQVSGAKVRTVGDLPPLLDASATVSVGGTRTLVKVHKGKLDFGKKGRVTVKESQVRIGSYTKKRIDTSMDLNVVGSSRSFVNLGSIRPLSYSKSLNFKANESVGDVTASVKLNFSLKEVAKKGVDKWSANIQVANGRLKQPIGGYKISKANLKIDAKKGIATVQGPVHIDGFPAEVSLVEFENNPAKSTREIKMTLDDAGRDRFGASTGDVLTGPVRVTMNITPSGKVKVLADLKNAVLNLSWVGWAKGKNIPASVAFDLGKKDGHTLLENFVLKGKGKGFSAHGKFSLDSKGMRSANLKRIKLNKTDDFDVVASRTKRGFDITFNARSYDGRALIQSFVQSGSQPQAGKLVVNINGHLNKIIGFGGQSLKNVKLNLVHNGSHIEKIIAHGKAPGNAVAKLSLLPIPKGAKVDVSTTNAGSVLRFLDLYTKMRGGRVSMNLVRDKSNVYRGLAAGRDFTLLDEPRLAALLTSPRAPSHIENQAEIVAALRKLRSDKAKIDRVQADVTVGKGFFNLERGRLTGGDASAEFSGKIYDRKNRMNVRGTYLPARSLNRLVSKIPILGLALGRGKVSGLLGITFSLSGHYRNPRFQVNPLSIITPGVFRQIFRQ